MKAPSGGRRKKAERKSLTSPKRTLEEDTMDTNIQELLRQIVAYLEQPVYPSHLYLFTLGISIKKHTAAL